MIFNNSKTKININVLMYMILIFLLSRFFSLTPISSNDMLSYVYTTLSKAAAILAIMLYLKSGKVSKFMLLLLTYYFILFLSTLVNDGNLRRLIMTMYPTISMCALIEIGMRKSPRNLLKSFIYLLGFFSIVNFIMLIVSPDHYPIDMYFMGLSNQMALAFIILSVCLILYSYNYKTIKKLTYLFLILNTITILIIWSGNNIIAWGLFLLSLLLLRIKEIKRIINFRTVIIAFIIIYIGIVIIRIQNWGIFKYLIEDVLGKDVTLSFRTNIWDIVLSLIKEKPLIGHGIKDTVNLFYIYLVRQNRPTVDSTFSGHNQLLQTMYEGGLASLFVIFMLLFISGKKLMKVDSKQMAGVITAGIFSVLVIMMAESCGIDAVVILMSLAYCSSYIKKVEVRKNF